MVFPVPSLRALSLATISTHIWRSWDLSSALIDISLIDAASELVLNGKTSKETHIPYYSRVKPAYDAIMAMDPLLESVKVQIACAFIKLEANMLQWAKEIIQILRQPKRRNVSYCLAKTVVRANLTVDRETTMFNVLFDSYGKVRLRRDIGPGNICVLTVRNLSRFIKNGQYRKHGWLSKKIRREIRRYDKPLEHWVSHMRSRNLSFLISHTKLGLLLLAIKDTKLEVFENLLYKLSHRSVVSLPPRVLTLLLSHAMLGDKTVADFNIVIYLLNKLHKCDEKLWLRFLTYWFCHIVFRTYASFDPEFAVMYFREGCAHVSAELCASVLKNMLEEINPESSRLCSETYGQTAQLIKRRGVFFEIWNRTPDKVKQMLFDFFTETNQYVAEDTDSYFLSLLLTDKAFTADQRKYLLLVKVLDTQEDEADDVLALLSHVPEHYRDFVKNPTKEALRKYMTRSFRKYGRCDGVRFVFKTEAELNNFKEELIRDKDFVVEACVAMGEMFCLDTAYEGLLWLLNTNEAVNKFLQDKLVSQQWVVDIIKKYLILATPIPQEPSLMEFLVQEPDQRLRLKKIIRKDIPLMLEALNKISFCDYTSFLDCIFDPNEIEEQKALMETYLMSENGLRMISEFVTHGDNIKHVGLYSAHYFRRGLALMKLFKTNCLQPLDLTHKVIDILSAMKIQGENPVIFPHQTEKGGEDTVVRNHRMFLCILKQDIHVDQLLLNYYASIPVRHIALDDPLRDDLFL